MITCDQCGVPFDEKARDQDNADYTKDICGGCVNELEEQKNQWWQSMDCDLEWIEENA